VNRINSEFRKIHETISVDGSISYAPGDFKIKRLQHELAEAEPGTQAYVDANKALQTETFIRKQIDALFF